MNSRGGVTRRFKVIVCRGPECGDRRDSVAVHRALARELADRQLGEAVELGWQSCFGRCTQGPNVLVAECPAVERTPRFALAAMPTGRRGCSALYNGCAPGDAAEIIEQHVVRGTLVRRLIAPIAATAPRAAATAQPPPVQDALLRRRSDGDR
jgi:(2Fe-2S) ferredoxin